MEFKCSKEECDGDCPEQLINMVNEVLSNGRLIVYPTETIYGIGGDPLDESVIKKIKEVKNAPPDKKISVAYNSLEQASEYLDIPDLAWEVGEEFLPGPLTIVVETDDGTEGIRVSDHPMAQAIIEDFGPITSTSANVHGRPDPIDVDTAKIQLDDGITLYVNCGDCKYGIGTTVVKITDEIEILREGVVEREDLEEKWKVI